MVTHGLDSNIQIGLNKATYTFEMGAVAVVGRLYFIRKGQA